MKTIYIISILLITSLLISCEKEVTVQLPEMEQQIVVEGSIEMGRNPTVILTRSIPYYASLDEKTLAGIFVNDAIVKIVSEGDTIEMKKFCLEDVPDSLQGQVAELLNLPPGFDKFCIYYSDEIVGKANTSYELIIDQADKHLTSTTYIPTPVALDSLWFKPDGGLDSLGFIYGQLSDPAAMGNAYRWFAKRINSYTYGKNAGEQKDADFIAPFNSAFDDEFFNGVTFPFAFNRGRSTSSDKADDENIERGYFKIGDTVVVKFASTDFPVFQYYRSFYNSIGNSGSPFASPANIKTNIKGGLGVWAGYGAAMDTLVIR